MAADLKYLFVAAYRNGTIFEQNIEDVSVDDPKRSAFFDVDQAELECFMLIGPQEVSEKNQHVYLVNLSDGHFEVDGVPVRFHDSPLKNIKLVFFRKHRVHQDVNLTVGKNRELHVSRGEQFEDPLIYRFGWEAEHAVTHEKVQRVMEID